MQIQNTTSVRLKLLGGLLIGGSLLHQIYQDYNNPVKDAVAMLRLNDEEAREKAIKTLSHYKNAKDAKKELLQELKNKKSQIPKHEIANVLIQVSGAKDDERIILTLTSDENTLEGLIEAINKNPSLVTAFMAFRLGELESKAKGAEVPLAKALKMGDLDTKVAAVFALGNIGVPNSKETVFNLFDLLKDEDNYFRSNASGILAKVPEELKISSFIELLKIHDSKKDVFHFFIKDIGPKGIPNLLKELNTEANPVHKANIILLLGNLSTECRDQTLVSRVLDALIQGLSNNDKWVRYNSCYSLELLANKAQSVLGQLEKISKSDKSEEVRTAASDVISALNEINKNKIKKNELLNRLLVEYLNSNSSY